MYTPFSRVMKISPCSLRDALSPDDTLNAADQGPVPARNSVYGVVGSASYVTD